MVGSQQLRRSVTARMDSQDSRLDRQFANLKAFIPMKTKFAFLAALILALNSLFAGIQSADYYLNSPEKYVGKKITLYTAYVNRATAFKEFDGVLFRAYTMGYNDQSDSSSIYVVVPKSNADNFARRYGSNLNFNGSMGKIKTLPMSGTFKQADDIFYLQID